MEVSRQSHEADMLQRATQESQEAAAAAVATSTAPQLSQQPLPASPLPSSATADGALFAASAASGGGPDAAVLPPAFGEFRGQAQNVVNGYINDHVVVGAAHAGTGGGEGAGGFQAGAGAGGGSALGSSNIAWMTGGSDDQEVGTFVGKGKGRCRD